MILMTAEEVDKLRIKRELANTHNNVGDINHIINNFFKKEGIYTTSKHHYKNFWNALGEYTITKNLPEEIIVVKRNDLLVFFVKVADTLFLLHKSRLIKAPCQNLQHYYDSIDSMYAAVENMLTPYYKYLSKISKAIQSLGGSGSVHGSIIDINFLTHLFVNPIDSKITFYYATSTSPNDRVVFANYLSCAEFIGLPLKKDCTEELHFIDANSRQFNVEKLVQNIEKQKKLKKKKLEKLLESIEQGNFNFKLAKRKADKDNSITRDIVFAKDGSLKYFPDLPNSNSNSIYGMNLIIYRYQYLCKYKVFTIWNEDLLTQKERLDDNEIRRIK